MEAQRAAAELAQKMADEMRAVHDGDMDKLSPFMKPRSYPRYALTCSDVAKTKKLAEEEHLDLEKLHVYPPHEGETAEAALEGQKAWLKGTFGNRADAMLVRTVDGRTVVAIVGISIYEADAARELQGQQREAQKQSDIVTDEIRERVQKAPARRAADEHEMHPPSQTPGNAILAKESAYVSL